MRSLVIAVDCDDVLVSSTEYIVEQYNKIYGTSVQLAGAHTSPLKNPDWQASRDEISSRMYDIQLTDEFGFVEPREDAIAVCARLAKTHRLHLVTARPGRIMSVTLAMLEKYFYGVFDEIEHVGLDGSKGDTCRLLQADVLIDDNQEHLVSARDCGVAERIWFGDYPWQTDEPEQGVVTARCLDWSDVEAEIDRIAAQ